MSKMKELYISLCNGDVLTDVERDYLSTLSPQEYAEAVGRDVTHEEYLEELYLKNKPTTQEKCQD